VASLLDTSALLAHYRGERGGERVQALFAAEEEEILMASVSIPELARRLRDLGMEEPQVSRVVADYRQIVDAVVAVDMAVAEASDEIVRRTPARLPLIDALIAACAHVRNARLVHRDAHMRAIPADLLDQQDLDDRRSETT
jgi:predicted nucleic acid-binding protein